MMHPRKGEFFSSRVCYISLNQIRPNPQQPRRSFDEDSLSELAESIRRYGILQPLTVRRQGTGYELVARRTTPAGRRHGGTAGGAVSGGAGRGGGLGAAGADGEPPAPGSGLLGGGGGPVPAHRPLWAQSGGDRPGRLGRSQPGGGQQAAGCCGLPDSVRQFLQENGLTERHARALLRLGTEEQQLAAAQVFCRRRMNVAAAEAYIEDLLHRQQVTPPKGRTTYIIKDVRLFLNSVDRGLHLMRQAGVNADWGRQDTDEEILLTIRIPKRVRT